jgi:hypothetical protein
MSKKSRRKEVPSAPRRPWLWLAMGAAVLLIAGGLVVWSSSNTRPAVTPQATGAPRLAVGRTTVDAGYVKFDKLVHTTFRLRNVGDQPLQILGEPQVELVEGC